jgi:hypothetical protein
VLVVGLPPPCHSHSLATGRDEHLSTAKATLVRALEMTEKLLDGFPIPGAKGTIGAVLHIINEAEVCTKAQPCYFIIFIGTIENSHKRKTL